MHAGAQSFLVKPLAPAKTLEAIRETHTAFRKRRQALLASLPPSGPVTPPRVRGKRIVVFGAKGGVGKTTLAVNLSVALKQITHASVMLMDADFYFGDAGIQMNLNPLHTVIDLLPASNDLDPSLLDQVMVTHKSGVQVLTGPGRPEEAEHITAQHVEDILQYLPRVFDYVIVDCSPSYDERMLRVLDQADLLLLVLTPEVGAIRNTGYFLDLAKALGYREDKIILVLNRANSNVGISMPAVENNLKQPILFKINSGGRLVALAANRGEPLVLTHPQADLSRAVFAIAQHIRKVMAPAAAG
jgi:pilus assembly protein CpaE